MSSTATLPCKIIIMIIKNKFSILQQTASTMQHVFLMFFIYCMSKVHRPLNEQSCRRLLTNQFPVQESLRHQKCQKVILQQIQDGLIENKVLIMVLQSSSPSRFCLSFFFPPFCLQPPSFTCNCEHFYHQVNQSGLLFKCSQLIDVTPSSDLLLKSVSFCSTDWTLINLSLYHPLNHT